MRTNPQATQSSLRRRIRQFYKLLSEGQFARCHEMIDPRVRQKPTSVTLLQYTNAASDFVDRYGPFTVLGLNVDLHLGESSALYEGRDFAVGKTICKDSHGQEHVFSERWVRDGRAWYNRCTGFVTPRS